MDIAWPCRRCHLPRTSLTAAIAAILVCQLIVIPSAPAQRRGTVGRDLPGHGSAAPAPPRHLPAVPPAGRHRPGPGRRQPAAVGIVPVDPFMPLPHSFGRSTARYEVTPWLLPPTSTLLTSSPAAALHQFHSENAFRGKSYATALRHAQHALVEDPENIHLSFYQSQILLGLGDVSGSADVFRRAYRAGGASRLAHVAAALSRVVTAGRARELMQAFPPAGAAAAAPLDVRLLQAFQYQLAGDGANFAATVGKLLDEQVQDPILTELAVWGNLLPEPVAEAVPPPNALPPLELLPYPGP